MPLPSSFHVTSGGLCFGSLEEVISKGGLSTEIQRPSLNENFDSGVGGGTVLKHTWTYNIAALNGIWTAHPLRKYNTSMDDASTSLSQKERGEEAVSKDSSLTNVEKSDFDSESSAPLQEGWMVVHESLSKEIWEEAHRILSVANSPYESDNATNRNTTETFDGRVMVINRYDWDVQQPNQCICFLVDHNRAHILATSKSQPSSETEGDDNSSKKRANENELLHSLIDDQSSKKNGIRLVLNGEYGFGRFGLTDDRQHVHSFLFFTSGTELSKVSLPDDPRPVYTPLTKQQRHEKFLSLYPHKGHYSGFDFLRMATQPLTRPLFGPFDIVIVHYKPQLQEYQQLCCPATPLEPTKCLKDLINLLNEMACSWVVHLAQFATDNEGCSSQSEFIQRALPALPPHCDNINTWVTQKLGCADSDVDDKLKKSRNFLDEENVYHLVPGQHKLWTLVHYKQLEGAVHYLLGEVLELAGNCARDNCREVLVPYDIRVSVANDFGLYSYLAKHSKAFFPPERWPKDED